MCISFSLSTIATWLCQPFGSATKYQCAAFFARCFLNVFFIIVFCFAIASANSMEIHAVKMPQKMPNKTPKIAQQSLISTVSSCPFRTFFPTKQAVCVFVLVFYSEIFLRCCRSWTKLQIGLKAYKLYGKSAASLGKCSAALSAHYPISGPPPGLPACLHLRLATQGKPYVGALARSVQCGHNYR